MLAIHLNPIIIGTIIVTLILFDALPIGYAEYMSWSRYYPDQYDWITQILASNPYIAIGVFIAILSYLAYTIYKIFFRYKEK